MDGGNITYVLVPTENLPLLNGLRRVGLNQLADEMQVKLKPKIDAGYDRSYIPAEALASNPSIFASPATVSAVASTETATVIQNPSKPATDKISTSSRSTLADSADDSSRPVRTGATGTVKNLTQRAAQALDHLSTSLRSSKKDSTSKTSSARKDNQTSTKAGVRQRGDDSEG